MLFEAVRLDACPAAGQIFSAPPLVQRRRAPSIFANSLLTWQGRIPDPSINVPHLVARI